MVTLTLLHTGAIAVDADSFGEGSAPRVLTAINCLGNESNLLECQRVEYRAGNCITSGVVCQGMQGSREIKVSACWSFNIFFGFYF